MKTIAQQLNVKEFPFEIFDKNGNGIYSEYSNGFWVKSEYDAKGNRIYYNDSNSFWSKGKFDSKCNRIYYENSDGIIKDNRNIPEYTMEELVEKIGNFKLKK